MREEQVVTYLNILVDSLRKKEESLKKLKAETLRQQELLEADEFNSDEFDKTIDEKQTHIDELMKLDEGFLDIYEKVKAAVSKDASDYSTEMGTVKDYIKRQVDLSVELQSLEEKNRVKLTVHLSQGRQKVKDFRTNSKTAAAYYKNMSNHHQEGDSYFLDRKK